MELHLSTDDFELETDGYYEGYANCLRRSIDELTKDVEKAERDLEQMEKNINHCSENAKKRGYPSSDLWTYSGYGPQTDLIFRLRDLLDTRKDQLKHELKHKRVYVNLIKKKERSNMYDICKDWLKIAGIVTHELKDVDGIQVELYRWYFCGLLKYAVFNHPDELQNYTVHNINDEWLKYCKENDINILTGVDTIIKKVETLQL